MQTNILTLVLDVTGADALLVCILFAYSASRMQISMADMYTLSICECMYVCVRVCIYVCACEHTDLTCTHTHTYTRTHCVLHANVPWQTCMNCPPANTCMLVCLHMHTTYTHAQYACSHWGIMFACIHTEEKCCLYVFMYVNVCMCVCVCVYAYTHMLALNYHVDMHATCGDMLFEASMRVIDGGMRLRPSLSNSSCKKSDPMKSRTTASLSVCLWLCQMLLACMHACMHVNTCVCVCVCVWPMKSHTTSNLSVCTLQPKPSITYTYTYT